MEQLEYFNMKELGKFTIKEFYEYKDLLAEEPQNPKSILSLFGVDVFNDNGLDVPKLIQEVKMQEIPLKPIKKEYVINGKSYFLETNLGKMTAAQFIDFQVYMVDNKMQQILSIFMLPMSKKGLFGKKKAEKYGVNYDVLEVQNELLNHMEIADAAAISNFFLTLSQSLLKITKGYLEKEMKKMKKETEKES